MARGFAGRRTEAEAMARFWEERGAMRDAERQAEARERMRQEGWTPERARQEFEAMLKEWMAANDAGGATPEQTQRMAEAAERNRMMGG